MRLKKFPRQKQFSPKSRVQKSGTNITGTYYNIIMEKPIFLIGNRKFRIFLLDQNLKFSSFLLDKNRKFSSFLLDGNIKFSSFLLDGNIKF